MDGDTSPWLGRRVLVAGCTGFLGSAVVRELLARNATVVGLVRGRGRRADFARDIAAGTFCPAYGRVEDAARLHALMAVHEVSVAFELTGSDPGTDAVLRAAGLYHPRVPVVTARRALPFETAPEADTTRPLGTARFEAVFGPGQRESSRPADRAARDQVFVRDAARACLAVAEAVAVERRPLDRTFRSGWVFTDAALTAVLAGRAPGREPEPPPNPLGWRPQVALADAIAETAAWEDRVRRSQTVGSRMARRAA